MEDELINSAHWTVITLSHKALGIFLGKESAARIICEFLHISIAFLCFDHSAANIPPIGGGQSPVLVGVESIDLIDFAMLKYLNKAVARVIFIIGSATVAIGNAVQIT